MRRRERISYPVTVQPVEEVTMAELLLSLKQKFFFYKID